LYDSYYVLLVGSYPTLFNKFRALSDEISHLALVVRVDDETIDYLGTQLSNLIEPMVVARDSWIEKKASLLALEHGEPCANTSY
jgi:hypothetical protein